VPGRFENRPSRVVSGGQENNLTVSYQDIGRIA
jgi:hypothetical protein